MKRAVLGFCWTAAMWVLLVVMYSLIEVVRGNKPFEMMRWSYGGKFTIVILVVLALGTGIGYTSDRMQSKSKEDLSTKAKP